MKTLKNFIAIFFAAVLAINTAFANDGANNGKGVVAAEKFAYSLYSINQTLKFRLAFDNEAATDVSVRILDSEGSVVFVERLKGISELKRNYDLASVGKGIYTVEINAGDFKASQKVAVGGAKLSATTFNAYVSPALASGMFRVAYEGGAEGVYITVKDQKGAILYSEHNTELDNFSRRYSIGNLPAGEYTVSVSSGSKTVEQTYMVK